MKKRYKCKQEKFLTVLLWSALLWVGVSWPMYFIDNQSMHTPVYETHPGVI